MELGSQKFSIDKIEGISENLPRCSTCKGILRPNINLKNDMEWLENETVI